MVAVGLVALLLCGCQSSHSSAEASKAPLSNSVPLFPTFGTRTSDSICVLVTGRSVRQRGYYFLPRGATIGDAINAAQGLNERVDWTHSCWLTRAKADGTTEATNLTSRKEAEQLPLKDGDRLKFSHPIYE